jgi:phosphonate transport system permease protein
VAAATAGVLVQLNLSLPALLGGFNDGIAYLAHYRAPDFAILPSYAFLMGQTIAIAIWATGIAIAASALLAPLAAQNFSPHPLLYQGARVVLGALRTMPELLLVSVFTVALGFGPIAGICALGLHSVGLLGKLLADTMERVDGHVIEALRSTGAGPLQVIMFAAWPSIGREAAACALFVLDRNVRFAAVLGLIGAGGIGTALHVDLQLFQYDQSAALIILIIATIGAIDIATIWLRKRLA